MRLHRRPHARKSSSPRLQTVMRQPGGQPEDQARKTTRQAAHQWCNVSRPVTALARSMANRPRSSWRRPARRGRGRQRGSDDADGAGERSQDGRAYRGVRGAGRPGQGQGRSGRFEPRRLPPVPTRFQASSSGIQVSRAGWLAPVSHQTRSAWGFGLESRSGAAGGWHPPRLGVSFRRFTVLRTGLSLGPLRST
jgi:hypothetical protein